ncbi:hypothetical protein K8640_14650 [Myxococcus sp. XM-1-1-1]|uniref:hypothetical protein n=1 Tax=Myxococcus sp. XM-1-1-1 TaxID=2874602 RepID=UPI001CBFC950|nr:hypothetical protein [Myxococcus sp. XM-1-1-1]MBZ4409460.1 hypothetical protein [Myxococcus sp. XM-1-1-1]
MRPSVLWAGAVSLLLSTSAYAQRITPVEGRRSVSASFLTVDAAGQSEDSDFVETEGFESFNASLALSASPPQAPNPRLDATAGGSQSSEMSERRIRASLSAWASGTAVDASARGQGISNADMYLTFELNRRARYRAFVTVSAWSNASNGGQSFGGVSTLLHLANLESGVPVLSFDVSPSQSDTEELAGWLPAGPYTLQGDVSASVDARGPASGAVSGAWSMDLLLYCASDFDANGVVDVMDAAAFMVYWGRGSLWADIDGNGVVNQVDHDVFQLAYGRGC